MADFDEQLQYASDRIAITRVLEMERYHRDRQEWDEQRACYTDDCRIETGWFQGNADEFVEGSRRQVERVVAKNNVSAFHYLWPNSVRIKGDRALAETHTQVVLRALIDGVEVDLTCMTRGLSRVQRLAGRWRIASLHAIYVKDYVTAALPWQTVPIRPEELDGLRPSYRMNSWLLGKLGYPCDQDRLGEDRPEALAAFYRAADDWLSAAE